MNHFVAKCIIFNKLLIFWKNNYNSCIIILIISLCGSIMTKKQIEVQHRNHLLAGGPDKMWRIDDLRSSTGGIDASTAKRTLERWISAVPWLKSSHHANDQLDELNRPARQLVLDALVMRARKKRKAALFVQLHPLPKWVMTSNLKNITYWLQKMEKERNVGAYCATTRFHHC